MKDKLFAALGYAVFGGMALAGFLLVMYVMITVVFLGAGRG